MEGLRGCIGDKRGNVDKLGVEDEGRGLMLCIFLCALGQPVIQVRLIATRGRVSQPTTTYCPYVFDIVSNLSFCF